jgi:hydroxyacyl-ACP dehydratase HTD2-like protein with hotdog domain
MSATPQPQVGDALAPLVRVPTEIQLFAFSAATWNTHRIHYDRTYAREAEGYPDVLVQSHLHACFLAQAVTETWGPAARIVALGWQNRGLAVPGDTLTVTGEVTAADGERVEVALEERTQAGAVCVTGWATVVLARRG